MLKYTTDRARVALYDIRPGNGEGQFLQPRSPHGADCTWYTRHVVITKNLTHTYEGDVAKSGLIFGNICWLNHRLHLMAFIPRRLGYPAGRMSNDAGLTTGHEMLEVGPRHAKLHTGHKQQSTASPTPSLTVL